MIDGMLKCGFVGPVICPISMAKPTPARNFGYYGLSLPVAGHGAECALTKL
jgi:hypothetical protein